MAAIQTFPKNIMVLANAELPQACRLAGEVSSFLQSLGACSTHGSLYDEADQQALRLGEFDMLITLGGDGSMLRSGHLCAPLGIPLLGINIGHFGFLVELGENDWKEKLPGLLKGDYRLEERMMLRAVCIRDGEKGESWDVINEVVVCRGQYVRPIQVSAVMNDSFLTSYIADGLIVATATGSTAYALAAGGPILPPALRNILLMPIAPHLSLDRAIILAEGASVSVSVKTRHEAVVSVDGRDPIIMHNDDQVLVAANNKSLKMVRFQDPGYFYRNLTAYMEHSPMTSIKGNEKFVTK